MKKIPPIWKSSSKWFVHFHMCVMVLVFLFVLLLSAPAQGYDENGDRFCLAQNIYFEAGNQPFSGKLAVANVTLNRVSDTQFPDTVCDVVYQTKKYKPSWRTGELIPERGQCQFSWFCDGRSDDPQDSVHGSNQ